MRVRSCHRYSPEAGFTLLEMLVVLVIVAMALSVALLSRRAKEPSLQVISADLTSQLNLARVTAITRARPITLAVDQNGKALRSPAFRSKLALPKNAWLVFSPVDGIGRPSQDSRLTFFADGSSTGGAFKLFDRSRAIVVHVDWLSGAITRDGVR